MNAGLVSPPTNIGVNEERQTATGGESHQPVAAVREVKCPIRGLSIEIGTIFRAERPARSVAVILMPPEPPSSILFHFRGHKLT